MNYLAGKTVDFVNKSAMNGTILAHTDGSVPNLMVKIPAQDAYSLGQLFYFFEFACGVSGYILGVNPFNQPGVESYKKNMFALLGKPGYEAQREELLKETVRMKKYKIIYDDQDLLVVCKFAGLAVQSARVSTPDLMSLLRNEMLERGEKKPYLGLVNRLDQPVEGIVLIGKNEKAAADLSRQVTDHIHMEKWYQTVVCGNRSREKIHLWIIC